MASIKDSVPTSSSWKSSWEWNLGDDKGRCGWFHQWSKEWIFRLVNSKIPSVRYVFIYKYIIRMIRGMSVIVASCVKFYWIVLKGSTKWYMKLEPIHVWLNITKVVKTRTTILFLMNLMILESNKDSYVTLWINSIATKACL